MLIHRFQGRAKDHSHITAEQKAVLTSFIKTHIVECNEDRKQSRLTYHEDFQVDGYIDDEVDDQYVSRMCDLEQEHGQLPNSVAS